MLFKIGVTFFAEFGLKFELLETLVGHGLVKLLL